MPQLTNIERRVLAHLPVWHADEAWLVENEGGPDVSIRSYSLPDFTARLAQDASTKVQGRSLTEAECLQTLQVLASRGFAEERDGWRMTQAGFETLTGPSEAEDQVPGPVQVDLNPAVAESSMGAA
jgi:hypothetical protein